METGVVFFLAIALVVAGLLVAYELGQSSGPPVCPACEHCRDQRLERERLAREAEIASERFRTALERLAIPSEDRAPSASAGSRRGRRAPRGSGCASLRKILVAYDGGEASKRALDMAVALAASLGASLAVVSVVPFRPGRMPIDPADDHEVHARELLEAQATAARHGLAVELVEPVGEPAQAIEEAAERGGFDAVLVGSGRARRWLHALRGSVSAYLVAHSAKTVIVVR